MPLEVALVALQILLGTILAHEGLITASLCAWSSVIGLLDLKVLDIRRGQDGDLNVHTVDQDSRNQSSI